MSNKRKIVVFTDLDGSLLDRKYSYRAAKPIINELLTLGVSFVFCSSKTRAEIEFYCRALGIVEPFAAENGSAIFLPKGYFAQSCYGTRRTGNYEVIELGLRYETVRRRLSAVRLRANAVLVGFGDLSPKEIASETGLPLHLARLAKKREYDEPFRILSGDERAVLDAIEQEGLTCSRGDRYLHILGRTDKGKATAILSGLFKKEFGEILTFGVGNSQNDWPLLDEVNVPVFVPIGAFSNGISEAWKKVLQKVKDYMFLFNEQVAKV